MGNTPSNRKITVVNDEVTGIVRISDSVVRRLKGEMEGRKSRQPSDQSTDSGKENSRPSNEPVQYPSSVSMPPAPATAGSKKRDSTPYSSVMEDAHLTALKIRQEKEEEIRRVEEHWRTQLLNLTNHYNQLAQLTEAEYRAAMADVELSFAKESFNNVCSDQKDRVLKCYQQHKDQPLLCAGEVKQFAACVQQFREGNLNKLSR